MNAKKSASTQTSTKKVSSGDMHDILLALTRVHFAYDGATLTTSSKAALQDAAEKLRAYPDVQLYVDGHTDERGTTEYNMSLGDRRARAVVSYLKSCGVDPDRLNTVSFGEESPLDSGTSAVAYARNRRVDFRLISGNVQFVLEDADPIDDEGAPIRNAKTTQPATENHAG
jgi:peptidoglycan-associated lipoprotein